MFRPRLDRHDMSAAKGGTPCGDSWMPDQNYAQLADLKAS